MKKYIFSRSIYLLSQYKKKNIKYKCVLWQKYFFALLIGTVDSLLIDLFIYL